MLYCGVTQLVLYNQQLFRTAALSFPDLRLEGETLFLRRDRVERLPDLFQWLGRFPC